MYKAIFVLALFCQQVLGQQILKSNQYVVNKYAFNPALTSFQPATDIHIRQQRNWIGMQGAPVLSAATISHTAKSGLIAGFDMYHFKRGLLLSQSLNISAGYRLPVTQTGYVSLALQGQTYRQGLSSEAAKYGHDPALQQMRNTPYATINIAVAYSNKNFNIGITAHHLLSLRQDMDAYSRIKNYTVVLDYRLQTGVIDYTPYIHADFTTKSIQNWESGLMATLYEKFYVGTSHRSKIGPMIMIGSDITENIKFHYTYGTGLSLVKKAGTSMSSHELQISLSFVRKQASTKKEIRRHNKNDPENTNLPVHKQQEITDNDEFEQQLNQDLKTDKPQKNFDIPGYYLVTGSFQREKNARDYKAVLETQGYKPEIKYSQEHQYHYVYIQYGQHKEELLEKLFELRRQNKFEDAWVLTITNEQ